jgi:hypothetical protein
MEFLDEASRYAEGILPRELPIAEMVWLAAAVFDNESIIEGK